MNKTEYAVNIKHTRGNCAQAVLLAFAKELDLPEETLENLGAAFGVGMGCLEATCGALCAAEMVLGLIKAGDRPVFRDAAAMHRAFTERCGASLCKDLKGRDTGVVLCECDDCVRHAVEITEEMLEGADGRS